MSPFEAVEAALNKVFEKAKEKDISPPKHLLVFRGGISIGEVDILRTNEVIYLFSDFCSQMHVNVARKNTAKSYFQTIVVKYLMYHFEFCRGQLK